MKKSNWLCGKCEGGNLPKHSLHCPKRDMSISKIKFVELENDMFLIIGTHDLDRALKLIHRHEKKEFGMDKDEMCNKDMLSKEWITNMKFGDDGITNYSFTDEYKTDYPCIVVRF